MAQDSSKVSPIKAIHDIARRNQISAEYQLEKESGPAHAKVYTMRLRLGDKEYSGSDRSIKLAQRAAAQVALADHTHTIRMNPTDHGEQNASQSPTVALNTWATQNHVSTRYVLINEQSHYSSRYPQKIYTYRLHFGHDLFCDGSGTSQQQARSNCAIQALDFLCMNQAPLLSTASPSKSQISLMYERARKLGLSVLMEQKEPLTITYYIGEQYSTTATGATKQIAKEMAAERMLEILPLPAETDKPKSSRKRSNQHRKFIEQKASYEYSVSEQINPITRLYQLARARDIEIEFVQLENESAERMFRFRVKFGENDQAEGFGKNKQAAKRSAAENLLAKLNPDMVESTIPSFSSSSSPPPPPAKGLLKHHENSSKSQDKKHVHFVDNDLIEREETSSSLTYKQRLTDACDKLNILIQYDDQIIANNNLYKSFLSLSIADGLLAKFRGQGSSVTGAQENVSSIAWESLQDLFNGTISTPKTTVKKNVRQVQIPTGVYQP